MTRRIIIIEDHAPIAEGLRLNLEHDGYDVVIAPTGPRGLTEARARRPDLLILDLTLPGMDGLEVLRTLRAEGHDMPVLILSARGTEIDRVRGFRIGADDYVVKPFSLPELLARVAAMLRRHPSAPGTARTPTRWRFGTVVADTASHTVWRDGVVVELRPKEFGLLAALLAREGRVATRAELLDAVWRYEYDVRSRTVDVHVLELRRKLEAVPGAPQHLVTVRKVGYRLAGAEPA